MKIAAYQFPLAYGDPSAVLPELRNQINRCEALSVDVLCCAEAVLGGLADYAETPSQIAIRVDDGQLAELLAPLASDSVSTILGFTEIGDDDRLYNAAAVFTRGAVLGVYRKQHPAINRSVYQAGQTAPVFTIGSFTFGIMICLDSTFPEVAHTLVSRGAQALFVPTNNGMPAARGGAALTRDARRIDIACAVTHDVPVIRADVVGQFASLASHGATAIVDRNGQAIAVAPLEQPGLIVAELDVTPRAKSLRAAV